MAIDPKSIAEFLEGVNGIDTSSIIQRIKQRRGTWNYDHVRSLEKREHKIPKEKKEMFAPSTRVAQPQRKHRQFGIGRSTIAKKKATVAKKPKKMKKFGLAKKKISFDEPDVIVRETSEPEVESPKEAVVTPPVDEPLKEVGNEESIDDLLQKTNFHEVIRKQVANTTRDESTAKRVEDLVRERKDVKENHLKQLEKERQEQEKKKILEEFKEKERDPDVIPDVQKIIDEENGDTKGEDSEDDIQVPMPFMPVPQEPTHKDEETKDDSKDEETNVKDESPLKLPTRPTEKDSPLKLPTRPPKLPPLPKTEPKKQEKQDNGVKIINVDAPRRTITSKSTTSSSPSEPRDPSTKVISLLDTRENRVAVDYNNMSKDEALIYLLRATPSKIRAYKVERLKQFCKALGIAYKGTKAKTSAVLLELREQHVPDQ